MPMLRELRLLVGVAPPYNVNLTGVIFKASVPEISKKGKTWRKISLNDGKGMWVEVMVSGSIAESPMIQLNTKVVISGISARPGVQSGEKGSFWLYDSGHFICLPELAVAETANVQLLLRAHYDLLETDLKAFVKMYLFAFAGEMFLCNCCLLFFLAAQTRRGQSCSAAFSRFYLFAIAGEMIPEFVLFVSTGVRFFLTAQSLSSRVSRDSLRCLLPFAIVGGSGSLSGSTVIPGFLKGGYLFAIA
jgi:hypothetical protein